MFILLALINTIKSLTTIKSKKNVYETTHGKIVFHGINNNEVEIKNVTDANECIKKATNTREKFKCLDDFNREQKEFFAVKNKKGKIVDFDMRFNNTMNDICKTLLCDKNDTVYKCNKFCKEYDKHISSK